MGHSTSPPPIIRLVENDEDIDDEITQVTGTGERPIDIAVQERGRVSGVMLINPDPETLGAAFEGFEHKASQLSGAYRVTGSELAETDRSSYRLSIVKPAARGDELNKGDSITTVIIGLAADGSPNWRFNGDELDLKFQGALVDLMEDTIAEARRT